MATLSAPPLQSANPNPSPYLLTDDISGPEFTPESPASELEPEPQSPPSQATSPPPPTEASSLLHLSFNQNCSFFAAGTDRGFRVFSCDPFSELYRRDFDGGGFGIVEMLFQCNIHALVGGGRCPQYPPNKVMIWDDNVARCIGELCFRSKIRSVLLQQDRIVIILEQKICVYELSSLKILNQIETVPNPKGLCAVSQQQGSMLLVCPGPQKGQVRFENCGTRRMKYIMAHNSSIACLTLSSDGRLLATASSKGTLVRIFSTTDCTLLQEVRRGADRAEIHSLAFSENMQWLAVSSDKGTVHVFRLKIGMGLTANDKPRPAPYLSVHAASSFSFIKGVLPKYFSSEWSVAQYRLREGFQYMVAFGHQKNTLIILGMDGSFYRCEYDPVGGGEMKLLECYNFLKPDDTF